MRSAEEFEDSIESSAKIAEHKDYTSKIKTRLEDREEDTSPRTIKNLLADEDDDYEESVPRGISPSKVIAVITGIVVTATIGNVLLKTLAQAVEEVGTNSTIWGTFFSHPAQFPVIITVAIAASIISVTLSLLTYLE